MTGVLLALISALAIGLIGMLGIWSGMLWLFPSLGPTLALQVGSPKQAGSQPKSVIAGHLIGLASGFAAVYATGAVAVPAVTAVHSLGPLRVAAAALAMLLSMLVQHIVKLKHPPAEATTLLVALGALEPTFKSALSVLVGVLLIVILGEPMRHASIRLQKKT